MRHSEDERDENVMTSPATRHSLRESFTTLLLLTGGVAQAEDAMLEAIEATDAEDISDEVLLREGVAAALRQAAATCPPDDSASSGLPGALIRVLHLPAHLRHCFVLRVLASFSRAECAHLLNLSIAKVDQRTCEAMYEIARGRIVLRVNVQPAVVL
jgi:hypothetical protein